MSATILNQAYQLMTVDKANETAANLNADVDDDFSYVAVHCPNGTGWSFINIMDETGEFIGRI